MIPYLLFERAVVGVGLLLLSQTFLSLLENSELGSCTILEFPLLLEMQIRTEHFLTPNPYCTIQDVPLYTYNFRSMLAWRSGGQIYNFSKWDPGLLQKTHNS